jgi:hypothetical protein
MLILKGVLDDPSRHGKIGLYFESIKMAVVCLIKPPQGEEKKVFRHIRCKVMSARHRPIIAIGGSPEISHKD